MKKKVFDIIKILAMLSFVALIYASCVSTGDTQKGDEGTPTPKPVPTEEPATPVPMATEAPTEAPTGVPTQRPTAPPKAPGSSWITPEQINTKVNQKFTTEIHVHTGDKQKIAAYGFTLKYDKNAISLDSSFGNNGVEAGPQGFVNAINANEPGVVKIAGFDVAGKDPGKDLRFLAVHWQAKAKGSSEIELTIQNIVDNFGKQIGKSDAFGAYINVE